MVFAFGDYRLDIERRELRRGGACVDLAPKVFDLLTFLVRHRDRVVTKDDLLQAVWGGRIVSESALTTRINAARRAIGDDGATQRLVRTFARKGVRFIGDVAELLDPANPDAGDALPLTPPLPEKPSLVVLPFQNMSGDPEQEYFTDGIVEEITTAISRFPWLSVIARNSAFTYKGEAIDVRKVAHELGVRYALEGSVRKAGNRVRITGQLIDIATGVHIWADRFDGALDDIFDLQDKVASKVVGAIEPRLRASEIERAARRPTGSLDAYDFYLRAMAEYYKRTRDGHAEAVRLLRQVLELDPAYAPAMARIAVCRYMQMARHWIPAAGPEIEEGIRMARQAIAAGRDDPDTVRTAGFALAQLAGENQTALEALDRAILLNPNFAHAFGERALVLLWLNRPDEAIASAEHALRLSPHHQNIMGTYTGLAVIHATVGRYEEALIWADRALRENSGVPATRIKLSVLGHLGRLEEAEKCLRLLREMHPEPTVAGMTRDFAKGISPEWAASLMEGLRKAGLPEE